MSIIRWDKSGPYCLCITQLSWSKLHKPPAFWLWMWRTSHMCVFLVVSGHLWGWWRSLPGPPGAAQDPQWSFLMLWGCSQCSLATSSISGGICCLRARNINHHNLCIKLTTRGNLISSKSFHRAILLLLTSSPDPVTEAVGHVVMVCMYTSHKVPLAYMDARMTQTAGPMCSVCLCATSRQQFETS